MKPLQSTLKAFGILAVGAIVAGCNSPAPETTASTTTTTTNNTSAQPAATPEAFVRALHVVPGGPGAALMVDGKKVLEGVTYGNASQYVGVEPGKLSIKALADSGANLAGPMPQSLDKGEDLTVVINGVPGDVALLPFKHKSGGPEAGQAKIAFLHAAKALPAVDIAINGTRYRGDVEYGEGTEYKTVPAGQHNLQVTYSKTLPSTPAPTPIVPPGSKVITLSTPTPAKASLSLIQPANLVAGKVYSLIIFHDEKRQPKLRLLEDRFADTLKSAPSAGDNTATNATP